MPRVQAREWDALIQSRAPADYPEGKEPKKPDSILQGAVAASPLHAHPAGFQ